MTPSDEKSVLTRAIDIYGIEAQKIICIEEMSELMKELCKNSRGRWNHVEIAEEIADVEIMLEQMKMHYLLHDSVEKIRVEKIARLRDRLIETHGERRADNET